MAKKSSLPDLSARSNTYKSSAKLVNTRFYMIFGALLLSALLGLLGFIGNVLSSNDSIDLSTEIPKGKAEAELVAEAFLSGKPYPIDYAKSFNAKYDEFYQVSPVAHKYDDFVWKGFKKYDFGEIHYFYIIKNNPDYDLSISEINEEKVFIEELIINLIIDDNIALAALPFIKKIYIDKTENTYDYGDEDTLSNVPDMVDVKLEEWAKYYLADDRKNLQLVTPDNDVNSEYIGLGGFVSKGVEILSATPLNVEDGKTLNYNDWLLRVRVAMESTDGFISNMDVDITLTNATTAEPLIVGWGEAGIGVLSVGSNSREKR